MLENLQTAGIRICRRTFKRRLMQWGLTSYKRPSPDAVNAIRQRIETSSLDRRITDAELLSMLRADGYEIGFRAIGRLRRELGLYKRVRPIRQPPEPIEVQITSS